MDNNEIRRKFLRFFESKGHTVVPSSPLVPHGDPTLLLTTAGMVQMKPYFLGLATPPNTRLASCQKCFRTTDIDAIGDSRHLTFFEMLGNFSVGDYFKKEAIQWGWEFVTQHLKLAPDKLRTTVFMDDDEAFRLWREIGIPDNRIVRLGEKDNFWGPAGDSGPCGPCSEIHYDLGEKVGCRQPECGPGCDCGRFLEVWNLVFVQYDQDRDGKRTPLPRPNIDTGMGLERVAVVMQGQSSVYETDVFEPLVSATARLVGKQYGRSPHDDRAIRIVAEHSRGITFLITDGVLPSNEGRGYVLRRILRRASLFGKRLGLSEPFLTELVEVVVSNMGTIYPELTANKTFVKQVILAEETRFMTALDTGLNLLERIVDQAMSAGRSKLTGAEVFGLYDTYGFPKELTQEVARERGLSVDLAGFEVEMECQRQRARVSKKFAAGEVADLPKAGAVFAGYETMDTESRVTLIKVNGKEVGMASEGQDIELLLDVTPFYAEMGGQVGDSGEIVSKSSKVAVSNTVGNHVHVCKVISGKITVGDDVVARVEVDRRIDIARNHTATHLLQAALRKVLGPHVHQKGSLVAAERIRFDYPQLVPISKEQIVEIENFVNDAIRRNMPVKTRVLTYTQAIEEGATALFGEKYGETVRVIQVGETPVSMELCGGTHIGATGQIGTFSIVSESSIGTGLRRIEAVTGRGADRYIRQRLAILEAIALELESTPDAAYDRIKALKEEMAQVKKQAVRLEKELSRRIVDGLMEHPQELNGTKIISARVPPMAPNILREIGDVLQERLKSAVVVLGMVQDDRPSFVAMVTPDLVAKGIHAGEIIKEVARVTGGSGGGRAHLAQAGGKDKELLDDALRLVKDLVERNQSGNKKN